MAVILRILRPAAKALKGLSGKHKQQVLAALEALEQDPAPHDSKALRGAKYRRYGLRRKDVGEYRIVYTLSAEGEAMVISVVLIGKRNDAEIYRLLERLYS